MEAELPCCYSDMGVLAPAILFAFCTGDRETGRKRETRGGAVSDHHAQPQSEMSMSAGMSKGYADQPIGIQVTRANFYGTK